MRPRPFALLVSVLALLAVAPVAGAHEPDERAQGQGGALLEAPLARAAQALQAPPPTPRATCAPGDDPEPGMQGRNPADAPGRADGFRCNTELVGRHASAGGYKALRYVDKAGRECAYYDTTLLFPTNAVNLSQSPTGVAVLDMSDPANPKRTASLLTPAMQTPHESLLLNERRGLIAAVMGNPSFYPGIVDIYDISADCRNPVLQSSTPLGRFGHESGFAPDGNTFYATSIATGDVTALDVTEPKLPRIVWEGRYESHGLTVSDDGNRLYLADSSGLIILDASEIQARRPDPQVREVSRLDWPTITIPQVAHPVTIGGRPFLVEMDEFTATADGETTRHGIRVGAGRIIDIADETKPKVVSDLRLEVHQPENRAEIDGDPGTLSPVQGYAGHYCNIPRREEPEIVACSMILSGLRIFDIRDPYNPKELGYYVAPPSEGASPGMPSNYAMSSPEFVPERSEVWYTDGGSGFYNVRLTNWPFTQGGGGGGGGADNDGGAPCVVADGFEFVSAKPDGRGLRFAFGRRAQGRVDLDVFQVAKGRRVVRENRVARFKKIGPPFTWRARGLRDGVYFARFTMLRNFKRVDVQRRVFARRGGRFRPLAGHHERAACGVVRQFKLERPVFGGTRSTPLRIAYRLSAPARVAVTVLRGSRVVRQYAAAERPAGSTFRLALPARGLPRGTYTVRLQAGSVTATLHARRL